MDLLASHHHHYMVTSMTRLHKISMAKQSTHSHPMASYKEALESRESISTHKPFNLAKFDPSHQQQMDAAPPVVQFTITSNARDENGENVAEDKKINANNTPITSNVQRNHEQISHLALRMVPMSFSTTTVSSTTTSNVPSLRTKESSE